MPSVTCVMESRPDGRAVSVCEPSARSCEHQHVPLGVPPIPWLLPWLEPTRPKGGGGGKKHKHSSHAFPMYFMFSSPSLPFSIIYIHGKDIEESDNRSHDSPSQSTWEGASELTSAPACAPAPHEHSPPHHASSVPWCRYLSAPETNTSRADTGQGPHPMLALCG